MVLISVLTLLGIGAVAAVVLAVASRLLKVKEDPNIELITEILPGANCGGCGFPGCEGYAAAVVASPDVSPNLCCVGGADLAAKIGQLSGKAVVESEPTVAFRRCSRNEGNVKARYTYVGMPTCAGAAMLEGGPYLCSWACLGLGDCVRACQFDAMYIADGMVEVLASKCVSCGACLKSCPRSLLQLIPRRARVMNFCATREKLKSVSEVCDVGCINCLKCLKACPADAISYTKLRIEIDHQVCLDYGPACGEACVNACPRGILRRRTATPLESDRDSAALADFEQSPDAQGEKGNGANGSVANGKGANGNTVSGKGNGAKAGGSTAAAMSEKGNDASGAAVGAASDNGAPAAGAAAASAAAKEAPQ